MSLRLIITAAVALLIGATTAVVLTLSGGGPMSTRISTTGEALVGGKFSLVDHNGKSVSDADFRGKHMLIYFGFTHCPDICPSALQVMSAALEDIGDKAEKVTPIMITVDPERDTPELLKGYVTHFHPRMVGLTGSAEQVAEVSKAYRVYARKVTDGASEGSYTMDHSSIIYLMDPKGKFVTHFSHGTPVETMSKRLNDLL